MLSIGLWRRYINITITILDIIHRSIFYLKQNVSETGFCLRLQVESIQLYRIDTASLRLRPLYMLGPAQYVPRRQDPISKMLSNVQIYSSYIFIL
jgi:hypothetical protein